LTLGDVRLTGTAEFALVKRSVTADVDGTLLPNGELTSLALTANGLGVHVENVAHLTVSGQLALASLKSADGRSWTALKMGNVTVAGAVNLGLDGVTAQITVAALDLNLSADSSHPTPPPALLDWARAFDLDGDGKYGDLLDPGAELPTPVDLSIDYPSTLQLRVRGTLTGTGDYLGVDADFNAATAAVDYHNVILTLGDVRLTGTAEFALVKRSVTVDVDGTLLPNGELTSLALTANGLGVHVENVAHLTVSGQLALASLKSADGRSWTALKMGNVTVAGAVNLGLDGVTAQITVAALDLNLSADSSHPTPPPALLDWARAFDLDGDGKYGDLLDPGAELPTPVDLSIDYPSTLQLRVRGTLTGTGDYLGVDADFNAATAAVDYHNVILTLGDVRLTGTAEFALVKRSVTVDVDGTLLPNGELTSLALTANGLGVHVENVAHLTVSGQLALASLKSADGRSWTALKMGNVTVAGAVNLGLDGVTAQITVAALDLNLSADSSHPTPPPALLDWARAFDLDGDGKYGDLLDPGAELPTPVDLSIDYPSTLQLRVRGTLTGTGDYLGVDADFNAATAAVDYHNVILTLGDVRLTGTAEFALVKRSVTVDVDGTLLPNGELTSLALTANGLGVHVENVAHLTVSGQLALASLKSADGRSWTALKMGNVTVAGAVNLGLDGVTAQITVAALDLNLSADSSHPTPPPALLDWARAFDLDGDGKYGDLLDPGAELPTPVDLSIDYPSTLQLRVRGTLTGTGDYLGVDADFNAATAAVDYHNVILTLGDVRLTGTAEFALVKRSVTADVDGTLLPNGELTSLALTANGLGVHVENVAHLTVSGQLALASLKSA